MVQETRQPVILASSSLSRAKVLRSAGLKFDIIPAKVDEDGVKTTLRAEGASAAQCAETLAELKAVKVSQSHPRALIVGADQMLECNGRWFDKPTSMEGVKTHLLSLRGQTHTLATSVVVALNGSRIWHHNAGPSLSMRNFTTNFLDEYISEVGEVALSSVGAYQLEGRGVQLFDNIEGNFFTILGLPLLELLSFLREHKVVTQ
ncbi:MAG: septum formation protein Maf [Candidatus Marinimicrobia bacterium]|nr:septum formation protein Maf [Candidatus Neomarinimicrobiota bacterium]